MCNVTADSVCSAEVENAREKVSMSASVSVRMSESESVSMSVNVSVSENRTIQNLIEFVQQDLGTKIETLILWNVECVTEGLGSRGSIVCSQKTRRDRVLSVRRSEG